MSKKKKSKKKSKSPAKASASSTQTARGEHAEATPVDKAKAAPVDKAKAGTADKAKAGTADKAKVALADASPKSSLPAAAEKVQPSSTQAPKPKEALLTPAKPVAAMPKATPSAEVPKAVSRPLAQTEGKDAWNPVAVGFNGLGVLVGVALLLFGVSNTYKIFDGLWLVHLGESKAFVVSVTQAVDAKGKAQYVTVVSLPKVGRYPQAKVKIIDRRLYDYVKYRFHPPRALRLTIERVHRRLSGQAGIAKVGPLRLLHPPKSAEIIVGFGLLLLGGGICFSSLRDLRKRWLRRGLLA